MTDTKTPSAAENGATAMHAAFEAGLRGQTPQEAIEGQWFHHKDLAHKDLTAALLREKISMDPGPCNPAGTFVVTRPGSYLKLLADYSDPRTVTLANEDERLIVTVFDHMMPHDVPTAPDDPPRLGWGQYRMSMHFEQSRKLREWQKMTEWKGQEEFANFLEDHLEDVARPSGQELLAIATDLSATTTGSFKGRRNLDNGSVELNYQDDVNTSVEVPRELTLGIPLFEHGDPYALKARLRFRIGGGNVVFKLLFTNLVDALDQEFERIVQEIEEQSGRAIVRGHLTVPWEQVPPVTITTR